MSVQIPVKQLAAIAPHRKCILFLVEFRSKICASNIEHYAFVLFEYSL